MSIRVCLAVLLAFVALVAAGCGGYGDDGDGTKPGGGTTTNSNSGY